MEEGTTEVIEADVTEEVAPLATEDVQALATAEVAPLATEDAQALATEEVAPLVAAHTVHPRVIRILTDVLAKSQVNSYPLCAEDFIAVTAFVVENS